MSGMILGILAGVLSSVLSGVILLVIRFGQKKAQEREKNKTLQDAQRDKTEILTLRCLKANSEVLEQLVRCVRGEKPNGELTSAYDYSIEVKHDLNDHLAEMGIKK